MKHFLTIQDFSRNELERILTLSEAFKQQQKNGIPHEQLKGKTLAMLFEKPSNRTRVSFEVAMYQLGGKAINIRPEEVQIGDRESIADVARVFSRYVDAVMIRALHQRDIVEFANNSTIPVINGLSDKYHPCQALADILTIKENKGHLSATRVCYIGDGNNVCNSLINACELFDINLTICCPEGYEPETLSDSTNAIIEKFPMNAVAHADVIYTDVWTSMGQEHEASARLKAFENYKVTTALLEASAPHVIFMHCLPAHRGEEVDSDVLESSASVVFDQAENRLHAQKGILAFLMET